MKWLKLLSLQQPESKGLFPLLSTLIHLKWIDLTSELGCTWESEAVPLVTAWESSVVSRCHSRVHWTMQPPKLSKNRKVLIVPMCKVKAWMTREERGIGPLLASHTARESCILHLSWPLWRLFTKPGNSESISDALAPRPFPGPLFTLCCFYEWVNDEQFGDGLFFLVCEFIGSEPFCLFADKNSSNAVVQVRWLGLPGIDIWMNGIFLDERSIFHFQWKTVFQQILIYLKMNCETKLFHLCSLLFPFPHSCDVLSNSVPPKHL